MQEIMPYNLLRIVKEGLKPSAARGAGLDEAQLGDNTYEV
jgi:hypothetical protein